MKIVIDLDVTPEDFKRIQVFNIKMMNNKITHKVYEAVQKGIVLPKGHGRLIDADAYIEKTRECGMHIWLDNISVDEFNKITPTIIEADMRKE